MPDACDDAEHEWLELSEPSGSDLNQHRIRFTVPNMTRSSGSKSVIGRRTKPWKMLGINPGTALHSQF